MANTKNIADTQERKAAKRVLRKAFKVVYASLTEEQLRRFRKSDIKGVRKFLASK